MNSDRTTLRTAAHTSTSQTADRRGNRSAFADDSLLCLSDHRAPFSDMRSGRITLIEALRGVGRGCALWMDWIRVADGARQQPESQQGLQRDLSVLLSPKMESERAIEEHWRDDSRQQKARQPDILSGDIP